MKLKIGILVLTFIFTVGCSKTGTGGISPGTAKAIVQTAAITLEAVLQEQKVSWDSAQFNTDLNATINAFQVGATWKTQVLNLLPHLVTDVSALKGCNAQCTTLVGIFVSGIQAVIADLQGTPVSAQVRYHSYDEYVKDWNANAPADAQLNSNFNNVVYGY